MVHGNKKWITRKICCACKGDKLASHFYQRNNGYLYHICKRCCHDRAVRHYAANEGRKRRLRGLYQGIRSPPPPVRHPTVAELYWAAGFLEGEGTFKVHRDSTTVQIAASQVNPEPLDWLRALFGGSIGFRKRSPKTIWNSQDYYVWVLTGARAFGLMMTLYKLMTAKRQNQILKCIQQRLSRNARGRTEIDLTAKAAKDLGVDIGVKPIGK